MLSKETKQYAARLYGGNSEKRKILNRAITQEDLDEYNDGLEDAAQAHSITELLLKKAERKYNNDKMDGKHTSENQAVDSAFRSLMLEFGDDNEAQALYHSEMLEENLYDWEKRKANRLGFKFNFLQTKYNFGVNNELIDEKNPKTITLKDEAGNDEEYILKESYTSNGHTLEVYWKAGYKYHITTLDGIMLVKEKGGRKKGGLGYAR